jgi:hypothetical protein
LRKLPELILKLKLEFIEEIENMDSIYIYNFISSRLIHNIFDPEYLACYKIFITISKELNYSSVTSILSDNIKNPNKIEEIFNLAYKMSKLRAFFYK